MGKHFNKENEQELDRTHICPTCGITESSESNSIVGVTISECDKCEAKSRKEIMKKIKRDIRFNQPIGKWLLFVPNNEIVSIFQRVKEETDRGNLGIAAKYISDNRDPHAVGNDMGVICIYCLNSYKIENVARVAWRIYKLAIPFIVLNYKTDEATSDNKYSALGHKKISLYSIHINTFKKCSSEAEFIAYFNNKYRL